MEIPPQADLRKKAKNPLDRLVSGFKNSKSFKSPARCAEQETRTTHVVHAGRHLAECCHRGNIIEPLRLL
jgi:hypothetical protein